MRNINKFSDYVFEDFDDEWKDEIDPYNEEIWEKEREEKIKIVIDKYEELWKKTAPGKPSDFISNFPSRQALDDEEYKFSEDLDNYEWTPDNEVDLLAEYGIYIGNSAEDNVSTKEWCNFLNDLGRAGW